MPKTKPAQLNMEAVEEYNRGREKTVKKKKYKRKMPEVRVPTSPDMKTD